MYWETVRSEAGLSSDVVTKTQVEYVTHAVQQSPELRREKISSKTTTTDMICISPAVKSFFSCVEKHSFF